MDKFVQVIRILLLAIMLIIGFCILGTSLWLWIEDYESFTKTVLNLVGKEGWKTYFEQSVFPASRFAIMRYVLPFLCLLWLCSGLYFYKNSWAYSVSVGQFCSRSKAIFLNQIQKTTRQEKIFLLLIMAAFAMRGLLQLYRYELQYDEAWTYNHFVSKGFLISAISPNNNHILYSLLACLTDYLPLEAKYSLRLPVYLGGIATCFLFYIMCRSLWKWPWALVALAWFAFSPGICFYSMYARGYIFQIFCTILALWASLKLLSNQEKDNYYWTVWCLANIVGFYSVPTHAYVFATLSGVLFIMFLFEQKESLITWLKANIGVTIVVAMLYFPFIITNGLTVLLEANVSAAIVEWTFLGYQDEVSDWLLYGGGRHTQVYWIWLLVVGVLFILGWLHRKQAMARNPILLSILFLLLPTFLNLWLGTQPPFRIWAFLSVFCAMVIPIVGTKWRAKSSLFLIPIAIGFSLFNIQRTEVHYAIRWSADLDQEAKKIAELMLQEELETCYFFANYDKPLFEFYYLRAGKQLKTAMSAPSSKNYAPFVNAPLYESVCWDNEDGTPNQAQIDWFNTHYPKVLYKNNRIEIRLPN